ncbi:TlpA disulfide reductase family protein [Maridesulfovibrio sp.]|uniref:peroxiredoxin family protein n=1 Tax=Maridesulfovibrio sp. TaxID=2795000 RepID=UPI002A18AA3B|nr:TlpA disulfide reductase family protein [Maridesulfovibrio sp.]
MLLRIKFLILLLLAMAGAAYAGHLDPGANFPDAELNGDLTDGQRRYLGLKGDGPWKISDIDAGYVLVEIFSMYCPHCQKEAPETNLLYTKLLKAGKSGKIVMIGVGVGNSQFETDFFRDKYAVQFPLFPDPELKIHADVGGPGTPCFYLVEKDGAELRTVFSHEGRMGGMETFLDKLKKVIGK